MNEIGNHVPRQLGAAAGDDLERCQIVRFRADANVQHQACSQAGLLNRDKDRLLNRQCSSDKILDV